ncbi:3-isopropylmalate dehydratase small subunit [Marispirochaeta aestuarii]|uniref:3-isopropylmalate dehydratase n=1 Tax=Marispirochaeta aestuarii TaxID=1963862 RepID=A0A1Y1S0A1_9SPIO|nr:3-isopropylmalate dehydratase small subunit [Marispirochaeta aestuarii]ORC36557.1 3-isopropylmalate dehydratase small subunit [Marispirochaeta aestuarii]
MKKITSISGKALPIQGNDIDTDRVIPARYMKSVTFSGLGAYAFYDERYDEEGKPKDHPMNSPRYTGASIMVVNKNFGCGSSREHAPQALRDFGIGALVGESFAEIFAGNCSALGMPTVTVSEEAALQLQKLVAADPGIEIQIDLENMTIRAGDYQVEASMPETYRRAMLDGSWDSTSLLLQAKDEIEKVEGSLHYSFT